MLPIDTTTPAAGAVFDETRVYRYRLWRQWEHGKGTVAFIMLNPSTADEFVLDPTIKRCIGFAKRWGFGRLEVANIFALRSTQPSAIYSHGDPEGPDNRGAILAAAKGARLVVAAWGAHGAHRGQGVEIANMLVAHGITLQCLAVTNTGQPRHPLYLKANAVLRAWTPGDEAPHGN